eukprot:3644144-Alexandrium_andersonii.AAC.1
MCIRDSSPFSRHLHLLCLALPLCTGRRWGLLPRMPPPLCAGAEGPRRTLAEVSDLGALWIRAGRGEEVAVFALA